MTGAPKIPNTIVEGKKDTTLPQKPIDSHVTDRLDAYAPGVAEDEALLPDFAEVMRDANYKKAKMCAKASNPEMFARIEEPEGKYAAEVARVKAEEEEAKRRAEEEPRRRAEESRRTDLTLMKTVF